MLGHSVDDHVEIFRLLLLFSRGEVAEPAEEAGQVARAPAHSPFWAVRHVSPSDRAEWD